MRTIGTELTRLDSKSPRLKGVVIDPASLKDLLAAEADDIVSLQGPNMEVRQALAYAAQCLYMKAFPFVSDEGEISWIASGAEALHRRLTKLASADHPALYRATKERRRGRRARR